MSMQLAHDEGRTRRDEARTVFSLLSPSTGVCGDPVGLHTALLTEPHTSALVTMSFHLLSCLHLGGGGAQGSHEWGCGKSRTYFPAPLLAIVDVT